jgi:ribosomal protein S18 acetylase RimI-like enzyme
MEVRPAKIGDLERLGEIDGTILSSEYLHVERVGEGLLTGWRLEPRPARSKLVESNALSDDARFMLKQVVSGTDEGIALVAEHEQELVGLALASARADVGTLHLLDLRVDSDQRREGVATVMIYQIIQQARDRELRAVSTETRTNNVPAARMLQKLGFEMAGIDTHRHSNHDLVKESASIFWYAALD